MELKLNLSIFLGLFSMIFNSCTESDPNNSFESQNAVLASTIHDNLYDIEDEYDEKAKEIYESGVTFYLDNEYEKAKNIFLGILADDTTQLFNEMHYYSSDIGGFKTKKLLGYGSFSSHYKNSAAIYLAEIYIAEQQFEKALKYVQLADTQYPVQYNCGTGELRYTSHLKYLYAISYEGLGQYDKLLKTTLPSWSDYRLRPILLRAIKKRYTKEELIKELDNMEEKFQYPHDKTCRKVDVPEDCGLENEATSTEPYLSERATIKFFDYYMELPRISLGYGEVAPIEMYIDRFKTSIFYRELLGEKIEDTNTEEEGTITINVSNW